MSYLVVEGLTKTFGKISVLQQVSLQVERGKLVVLLGPSGCGKSTLLRCIAGLTPPDEGKIFLDQKEITHLSPKDRQVGMVFQSYALFPNMTAFENIAFGLRMKGMPKEEIRERVNKMIDLVHLRGKEDSYPHQLSGGQQQRVALVRSLVVEPKVLLLDEPLSALDAKIRKTLQTELRRIQQELNITTIFVTHDQEEALTLSDQVYVMDQGCIVQSGTPKEIYTSPATEFVARFIGNYNVFTAVEMQTLVGFDFSGHKVAIRPEVIQIVPEHETLSPGDDVWVVTGKIGEVRMMGNVLRYLIHAEGVSFHVDQLNFQRNWLPLGSPVKAIIPKSECIPLNTGDDRS